jgi:hypothetical protein
MRVNPLYAQSEDGGLDGAGGSELDKAGSER